MSLLETIIPLITKSTSTLDISIQGNTEGAVVRITPIGGAISETAGEEEKQLRAALSTPLKVTGSLSQIESELVSRIKTYKTKRNEWERELERIDSKVSGAKNAQNNDQTNKQATKSDEVIKPDNNEEDVVDELDFTL